MATGDAASDPNDVSYKMPYEVSLKGAQYHTTSWLVHRRNFEQLAHRQLANHVRIRRTKHRLKLLTRAVSLPHPSLPAASNARIATTH